MTEFRTKAGRALYDVIGIVQPFIMREAVLAVEDEAAALDGKPHGDCGGRCPCFRRGSYNQSLDEALNSGDGVYRP